MFTKVKAAGLDVWFHSDGDIIDILPDLVELGVDVLNCQASVIDVERLHFFDPVTGAALSTAEPVVPA